ncbi:MAG: cytosol nonspecific dipeptidase, partial [Candidatus Latescibacterota bacterium]
MLTGMEPQLVWKHFGEILTIPRCSGNEEKARDYVKSFAKRLELETREDDAGNIVVRVPPTPGRGGAPVVVLQGHLDMVCEKNSDVEHDFAKDPIRSKVD